jgi:hypothetical protein
MINVQDEKEAQDANFCSLLAYLALFLHGNQRRTRVANDTTSEELAYLQPVHGPRDLYPQKFGEKGDEKAAAQGESGVELGRGSTGRKEPGQRQQRRNASCFHLPSRRLTHLSPPTTKKSSEISGTRHSTEHTLQALISATEISTSPFCSRFTLSSYRPSLH